MYIYVYVSGTIHKHTHICDVYILTVIQRCVLSRLMSSASIYLSIYLSKSKSIYAYISGTKHKCYIYPYRNPAVHLVPLDVVCIHLSVYLNLNLYICTHTHTHIYIHTHTSIYIYIYLYVYPYRNPAVHLVPLEVVCDPLASLAGGGGQTGRRVPKVLCRQETKTA